jgi:hypothetical protein
LGGLEKAVQQEPDESLAKALDQLFVNAKPKREDSQARFDRISQNDAIKEYLDEKLGDRISAAEESVSNADQTVLRSGELTH